MTDATLPAGPFEINIWHNNTNLGGLEIFNGDSGIRTITVAVTFALQDRLSIKCEPTGGGGTGTVALSGLAYCSPINP